MLGTSQRAPGYRFQYQVPPTPSPVSNAWTDRPASRALCTMYMPAKPAPTTTTSLVSGIAPRPTLDPVTSVKAFPLRPDHADTRVDRSRGETRPSPAHPVNPHSNPLGTRTLSGASSYRAQ